MSTETTEPMTAFEAESQPQKSQPATPKRSAGDAFAGLPKPVRAAGFVAVVALVLLLVARRTTPEATLPATVSAPPTTVAATTSTLDPMRNLPPLHPIVEAFATATAEGKRGLRNRLDGLLTPGVSLCDAWFGVASDGTPMVTTVQFEAADAAAMKRQPRVFPSSEFPIRVFKSAECEAPKA